jgi:glycosyltransferase involved in cell wall biosynthesis
MPKFSIIIPIYSARDETETDAEQRHYRAKQVQRAIKSVIAQQFPDWELVLVDDGCTDETPGILQKFADSDKRIKIIESVNQNRAIARNLGMDKATGEWLCWLDSDDEYSTHYLRELNQATLDFPEYKLFNFGSIVHWPDHHTSLRSVFAPAIEGNGHEWFRSGHIGAGSFIFKRYLWNSDKKYRIPDEVNPYQFAAASKFDLRLDPVADQFQYDNTVDPEGAFSDEVYRHGLSLGNPWGDDALQFYLLTRDNFSKPLDVLLYIQYPRAHEEVYTHFGEVYD